MAHVYPLFWDPESNVIENHYCRPQPRTLLWEEVEGPGKEGKSHCRFGEWETDCMKLCLPYSISTSFLLFLLFMDPCPHEHRNAHCPPGSPHSGQSFQPFLGEEMFSLSLASRPQSAINSLTQSLNKTFWVTSTFWVKWMKEQTLVIFPFSKKETSLPDALGNIYIFCAWRSYMWTQIHVLCLQVLFQFFCRATLILIERTSSGWILAIANGDYSGWASFGMAVRPLGEWREFWQEKEVNLRWWRLLKIKQQVQNYSMGRDWEVFWHPWAGTEGIETSHKCKTN